MHKRDETPLHIIEALPSRDAVLMIPLLPPDRKAVIMGPPGLDVAPALHNSAIDLSQGIGWIHRQPQGLSHDLSSLKRTGNGAGVDGLNVLLAKRSGQSMGLLPAFGG